MLCDERISFIVLHVLCRLRTTQDVPLNPPIHPSRSIKQNKRKRSSKSATIAKLAKQQPVSNVATVAQKRSHDYYHGDDDCTLLLPDRDDNNINVKTSSVEDVTSNKGNSRHTWHQLLSFFICRCYECNIRNCSNINC